MTPIQQLMLGVGAKKKVYMDDVFNTDVFVGSGSTKVINNGIDLSGEGGLVWLKRRSASEYYYLFDTLRGAGKPLHSDRSAGESGPDLGDFASFNSNGYTLGNGTTNQNTSTNVGWSFRKAPGFFDVVTYTGNGTAGRTISHSLGSVPGTMLLKRTDRNGDDWYVYHKSIGATKHLHINETAAETTQTGIWNDTAPTSSVFSVGSDASTNASSGTYVCYLFAGGESTDALARSVDFDGAYDYMNTSETSDFAFGTGDFTVECWVQFDAVAHNGGLWNIDTGTGIGNTTSNAVGWNGSTWFVYAGSSGAIHASSTYQVTPKQWYHVAYVRQSNAVKLYLNGTEIISTTDTANYSSNQALAVGVYNHPNDSFNGKISNLRVVKGTAVYTESFRPPTEPLANITNTTMLCCNNSSVTGKTVGPSLTATGTVVASTDSPFDDPAGFVFGDAEDQNVIKCGSYKGLGTVPSGTVPPTIFLGWEPSWVMIKRTDSSGGWRMYDNMRGLTNHGDPFLYANASSAETTTSDDRIKVTSTGFVICPVSTGDSELNNGSGTEFVFLAIRRPDPLVQKPQLATDVFAMDTGNNSSTIPAFDSGFPVDFALVRPPASTDNWNTSARLISGKFVQTNNTSAESSGGNYTFDSNLGWAKGSGNNSSIQSWMWKRGAGFDVVAYEGNATDRYIPHSLNKTPEMVWFMTRSQTSNHIVWHKDISPAQQLVLNSDGAQESGAWQFASSLPFSSTHIGLKAGLAAINNNNSTYLALLFASVDGISKVGYYDGSSSDLPITLDFSPRFLIIKSTTVVDGWAVYDTVRGIGTGGSNDKFLRLNYNNAQIDVDHLDTTSTGFTLKGGGWNGVNAANHKYIYYAHA